MNKNGVISFCKRTLLIQQFYDTLNGGGACQICMKPVELCMFSGASVENHNHLLTNDNHNNGLLAGLYHQSGFSAHLHNCSIYACGLLTAISCCREVSD